MVRDRIVVGMVDKRTSERLVKVYFNVILVHIKGKRSRTNLKS